MCPILSPAPAVLHDHLVIGTNWSGTYTYRARELHRPQTIEQLQEVVAHGGQLHAVGTRHSFNDVADGAELISVADLPGEVIIDDQAQHRTGARRHPLRRPGRAAAVGGLGAGQSRLAAAHLGGRIGGDGDPRLGQRQPDVWRRPSPA